MAPDWNNLLFRVPLRTGSIIGATVFGSDILCRIWNVAPEPIFWYLGWERLDYKGTEFAFAFVMYSVYVLGLSLLSFFIFHAIEKRLPEILKPCSILFILHQSIEFGFEIANWAAFPLTRGPGSQLNPSEGLGNPEIHLQAAREILNDSSELRHEHQQILQTAQFVIRYITRVIFAVVWVFYCSKLKAIQLYKEKRRQTLNRNQFIFSNNNLIMNQKKEPEIKHILIK